MGYGGGIERCWQLVSSLYNIVRCTAAAHRERACCFSIGQNEYYIIIYIVRLCPLNGAVAGVEHALGCEFRQHSHDGLKPKASEHEHRGIGRVGNDIRRGKEENRQGNEVW